MANKVVGVSYDPVNSAAPIVMLKAAGDQAELIKQAALAEEVMVIKDPELVRDLYRVPIDSPVGRELFPLMAAVLAHVIQLDRNRQRLQGDSAE